MFSSRLSRAVVVVTCLAVLVACGGSDLGDDAAGGDATAATDPEAGGNQAATTAPPPPAPTLPEVDGEAFTDPEGSYEIEIDPEWDLDPDRAGPGSEFWLVAKEFDGFLPNVNLLTQTTDGLELQEYIDLSLEGLDDYIDDADLLDERIADGTSGDQLGLLEYTGAIDGLELHFLQLVAVDGDEAVVATFTAPVDRFEDLRAEIEPFLFTLRSA